MWIVTGENYPEGNCPGSKIFFVGVVRGGIVKGKTVLSANFPRGYCPGSNYRRAIVRGAIIEGGIVLEPS